MLLMTNYYPLGFLTILIFSASSALAQQQYSGNSVSSCNHNDETGPSPAFLYTCNGERPSCEAFLMFRTEPPDISVSSIANLMSCDPMELARVNKISSKAVMPPEEEVIVPVNCSCTGKYYQANTSYMYRDDDTYLTIANNTYQGLTTCDALMRDNPYDQFNLSKGLKFQVPLRCACPTLEQITNGTKFLFTYLVKWDDSVSGISRRFNISARSITTANGFHDEIPEIYPFTTLLIPLPTEPVRTQVRNLQPTVTSYPMVPLKRRKKSHRGVYVGIGVGATLAALCFVLVLGLFHCRRKPTIETQSNIREGIHGIGRAFKVYKYQELQEATNNFSTQVRLSDSVYRGKLHDKLVAIKKITKDLAKEIKIFVSINHVNLISLYGVCEHGRVSYLVYEYLEEGSLRDWLHKENSPLVERWNQRIIIALDVANGLDYLHNCINPAHVHKGISSDNILLNKDLRAKIANFSFARENTNSHTRKVVGEKGYMTPEYMLAGKVTPKTDVYAFGVVLLELITGRDAVFLYDGEEVFLSAIVASAMEGMSLRTDTNDLIDLRLQEKHPLGYIMDHSELAWRLLKLSMACLAPEPTNRLSMAEVVLKLVKIQEDVHKFDSFSLH